MVEADDVFAPLAAFALNANQFARIDMVAVLRRIRARVGAASDGNDSAAVPIHFAKQYTATLVRIGLLAVLAKSFVIGAFDLQHIIHLAQSHRETYFFFFFSVALW